MNLGFLNLIYDFTQIININLEASHLVILTLIYRIFHRLTLASMIVSAKPSKAWLN